jgi:hypothetical protein
MKNIYLIPTDKPSRLFYDTNLKLLEESYLMKHSQNIYIISDEEIKEGDNSFYSPFGVGKNIIIDGELCFHIKAKDDIGSFTQRTYQTLDKNKKIILTTDEDLIKDDVQAIDDEFLEWFVKNPTCEWVEIRDYRLQFGSTIYKIIIPQEEHKQPFYCSDRLELDDNERCITQCDVCGDKPQQEFKNK